VRRLYGQFRQLIHEGTKFLVVGGIGLVVTNAAYGLLRHYAVGPVTATTVATIVATVVTYVGNRYWSFSHRERAGIAREGIIFLILNGVGLLIQDAFVGFNYYVLGLGHERVAQFIALNAGIAAATVFRFWSYRKWVWVAPAADLAVRAVPAAQPASGQRGTAAGCDGPRRAGTPLVPLDGYAANGSRRHGHGAPANDAGTRAARSR
jgi:putative flippase GtrA